MDNLQEKSDVAKKEEEILSFWEKNNTFEKSVNKDSPKGEYVFYDGPPFATGIFAVVAFFFLPPGLLNENLSVIVL